MTDTAMIHMLKWLALLLGAHKESIAVFSLLLSWSFNDKMIMRRRRRRHRFFFFFLSFGLIRLPQDGEVMQQVSCYAVNTKIKFLFLVGARANEHIKRCGTDYRS